MVDQTFLILPISSMRGRGMWESRSVSLGKWPPWKPFIQPSFPSTAAWGILLNASQVESTLCSKAPSGIPFHLGQKAKFWEWPIHMAHPLTPSQPCSNLCFLDHSAKNRHSSYPLPVLLLFSPNQFLLNAVYSWLCSFLLSLFPIRINSEKARIFIYTLYCCKSSSWISFLNVGQS